MVGHSLGSLMVHEISRAIGSNAQMTIALDPPRTGRKVQETPSVEIGDLSNLSSFSRSFVGRKSKCGSHDISKSADESILVNFMKEGKDADEDGLGCNEHGWVKQIFVDMATGDIFDNGDFTGMVLQEEIMSLDDKSKHNNFLVSKNNCWAWCDYYEGHEAELNTEIEVNVKSLNYWVEDQGTRQELSHDRLVD